jgi:putative membrane protein
MMFFGGWMWLLWIAVIGLIIWGVVIFTRRGEFTTKRTPLEIAKERYAKSEISKEEYEEIKKNLS